MSPLSAEYRPSTATTTDSDSDDDGDNDGRECTKGTVLRGRSAGPGALTVTQSLLSAFTSSLDAHKVRLRFFAGGWASLRERLLPTLLPRPAPPAKAESEHGISISPPSLYAYDIVLASETIYRAEAGLDAFLGVLRAATMPLPAPSAFEDAESAGAVRDPPLCLVAAKVLYFGVGGGVEGFVRAVEAEGGTVHTVWEHLEGVGRRIMRIEW
jgi:protein-histidine N-methyltransferase